MHSWKNALLLPSTEAPTHSMGGGLGVRFLLDGARSEGRFALVEHPLEVGFLGAPLHTHAREDEFSFVLEGRLGVQIGDDVFIAEAGALVFKPRGVPHTFWNAGQERVRFLEIVTPAGFEHFFAAVGAFFPEDGEPDMHGFLELCERYQLKMDLESVPHLLERHGLDAI